MKTGPFKMKGFSGYGNSPVKMMGKDFSKTKTLKGTTVFGKEVNKKNVRRVAEAVATSGMSELARKAAKTNTGKKVIKRVKRAGKNINDALKNDVLLKGIKKLF